MKKKVVIIIFVVFIVFWGLYFINNLSKNAPSKQFQSLIEQKHNQQLQNHIDFKNAKTLKEATEFGDKYLGIKMYTGFSEENLDAINWVNEAIVNVINRTKGKAYTPFAIHLDKSFREIASGMVNFSGLKDKELQNSIGDEGVLIITRNTITRYRTKAQQIVLESKMSAEEKNRYLAAIKLNNAYARMIYINYLKSNPKELKKVSKGKKVFLTPYSDIYHEMGHLQHQKNIYIELYRALGKSWQKPKKYATEANELIALFNNSKNTTSLVSSYATASPLEFVAEVYCMLIYNIQMPKEVMDLYLKLGGVTID